MPFNESLDALTIDWLIVKVIITTLYIISHCGCGFACPEDTFIPMTYQLFSLRKTLRSLVSSNNKQGQSKNAEGWWHPEKGEHLLTFSDQLQPDGTANRVTQHQDRIGDFNVTGWSCWQGCWQSLSTCHKQHADGNKYKVHFTLMLLPF